MVRYVCGQCGLDEQMTMTQTTEHWRECLLPLLKIEVNHE